MKNTTLILLFTIVMSFSFNTVAQVPYNQSLSEFYDDFKTIKKREIAYENIIGTPYIQKDFVKSSITEKDGSIFENILLKYNGYDDAIEYKHPNGTILQLANPENFIEFKIGDDLYIYYNNDSKLLKGYYQVLEDGKFVLLVKHVVALLDAEAPKAYEDAKPAKFLPKPDSYFVLFGNSEMTEINHKKELLNLMIDQKDKISAFIKKNKLKTKKEDDLKQIVAYYNGL